MGYWLDENNELCQGDPPSEATPILSAAEVIEKKKIADAKVIDAKIKATAEQIMADLMAFVAGMQGAPQSLKDAANIIAAEKAKKPK